MIDNYVRERIPTLIKPLIRLFQFCRLTPNGVSIVAAVIGLMSAYMVSQGFGWTAALVWWFSRIFDAADGIYARHTGQTSPFGSYLDITLDMMAYSAMILAFAAKHPEITWLWMIILFFYVLCGASALSLGSVSQELHLKKRDNRGLRLGAGLAEAGETGIAYTLFLLFPQWIEQLALVWIFVLALTVLLRTILAKKILTPER